MDKTMDIINVIEKRDFIHNYLHLANENTMNEFYEKLRKEEVLKAKLESRARKSESDIQAGRILNKKARSSTKNCKFWVQMKLIYTEQALLSIEEV